MSYTRWFGLDALFSCKRRKKNYLPVLSYGSMSGKDSDEELEERKDCIVQSLPSLPLVPSSSLRVEYWLCGRSKASKSHEELSTISVDNNVTNSVKSTVKAGSVLL